MQKIERNNRIIRQRAQGVSVSDIARIEAMSQSSVRSILNNHRFCITDEEPPAGLSVRNAWYIQQTFGFWPTAADTEAIAPRELDFLRGPGTTLRYWREIETWIQSTRSRQDD
jgi:hypothetical protein